MTRLAIKIWAFLRRDFLVDVSYRFAFLLQLGGMFFSVAVLYFVAKMVNPQAEGLDGVEPFPWLVIGMSFQLYFATALYSFSAKVRNEQVLGTLEAMLVSPTPTSIVIFSSAMWDFVWSGLRVVLYLIFAVFVFGVTLHFETFPVLIVGFVLTMLSSVGIGLLSASFILYFKRGDPINFLLSAGTAFFGNVFFPSKQLPDWIEGVSSIVPIARALNVIRGSLLQGKGFADLSGDLLWLTAVTAVFVPAGLLFSRVAIRRAKKEGTLVHY